MKLAAIEKEHLLQAVADMDREGDNSWAEYWVQLDDGREYQFKHLAMRAYEIATGEQISHHFFQSNTSYRSFIERKFGYKVIFKVPDNVSFFAPQSLEFFSQYAGTPYRSGNADHETAGKRIREDIFKKTNVWVRLLNLDDWTFEEDNRWQLSGTFKKYSWARIYKPKDKGAKVFFTIGVDGKDKILLIKLDCQQRQYNPKNALSDEQVSAFIRIRNGTGAQGKEISIDQVAEFDWENLKTLTLDFIGRYEFLYDEAIAAVRDAVFATSAFSATKTEDPLPEYPIPTEAFNELPKKEYSFKGVIVDYDAEHKKSKSIGEAGEKLVLEKEKKFLLANNLPELSEAVRKVKDGEGYDVLSFEINGDKKFIEVKTTSGINTRPFLMTDNEWEFMKRNSDQFHLYRVYDYDKETNRGKVFCLSGNLENRVFTRQKQIEVFLKSDC